MYLLLQTKCSGPSNDVETQRFFYDAKEQAMAALDSFIKALPVAASLGPGDFTGDDDSFTVNLGNGETITWVVVEISKPDVEYKVIYVVKREVYYSAESYATPRGAFEAMLKDMENVLTDAGELSKEEWDELIPDIRREIEETGSYETADMVIRTDCAWLDGADGWDWYVLEV